MSVERSTGPTLRALDVCAPFALVDPNVLPLASPHYDLNCLGVPTCRQSAGVVKEDRMP
jgi:hypothetical protein